MGGTKCLRLGTCELKDMGGVLQKNSSITERKSNRALLASSTSAAVCSLQAAQHRVWMATALRATRR